MAGERVPIDAQSVDAPLSRFAVFLVVTVRGGAAALATVRDVVSGIDDLVKTVGFRDLNGNLSCVVGVGAGLWDRLAPGGRPAELRPFATIAGAVHTAPSTPGDLLFHIRAERVDLCFEFERLLLDSLAGAVDVADETQGFRYFDARDVLGFVDGTANPIGSELAEATLIGDEDPAFAGGSYVVVQKYLHDMSAWASLTTEQQEAIIGRRKADDLELPDAAGPQLAHKTLATIVGPDGEELGILRDNMPFGRPGRGEFGTYFIGYSRRLWVTELMLRRMFVGEPVGYHDRILDVSTPITGTTFFVPSNAVLQGLATTNDTGATTPVPAPAAPPPGDGDADADYDFPDAGGSLGIGSLRTTAAEEAAS